MLFDTRYKHSKKRAKLILGDPHTQIELFVDADRVEKIIDTIMDTARTGRPGDGIVAVLPVERTYR